ncbi:MAG: hypothetical protein ABEI98_12460 [Halorhabdus sp.]
MTAGHIWNACQNSVSGDSAYSWTNYIGDIKHVDKYADYVLIRGGGYSFDNAIRTPSGTDVPIGGWYTKSGVDSLASNQTWVRKVGVTSGEHYGPVTGNGSSNGWGTCVDFEGAGVTAKIKNAEGDSGGPVYHYNNNGNGKAWLVNIYQEWINQTGTKQCHGGTQKVASKCRGTAFYHLNNAHGISTP